MADVDPFVIPMPEKVVSDPELRPYFEYLHRFLHDLWQRTGGGVDTIEDTAAEVTSSDGGNRTNRFHRDQLDDLQAQITTLKQPKKYEDEIDHLQSQIDAIPRRSDAVAVDSEPNIRHANYMDAIANLNDQLAEQKRHSRAIEQKLNDLIEQHDAGV